MKKLIKVLTWILSILLCAFSGFIIGINLARNLSGADFWIGVAVAGLGLIVINYLHIIMHEVGHLIGGKAGGYKLNSFRVGFLKIMRVNDKLKISFQKLGNKYGGVCQMYPSKNGDMEKSFSRFVRGGLVASAIVTVVLGIVLFLPYFFTVNTLVYVFFATAFPIVFITLVVNLSTTTKVVGMTDGMFLKALREKTPEGICAIKTLNLQSMFMAGIRPRDVSLEIVEDFPLLRDDDVNRLVMFSNQLACYIDRKDEKKVIEIANRLEENLEFLPTIYHDQIWADIFFVEAMYKHNVEKAKRIYEKIILALSKEIDISVLRIMVTYCKVVLNDIEKARDLAKHKDELAKIAPMSGIAVMESEIIDELIK